MKRNSDYSRVEDPPTPRLLNGGIPRDLEVICLKCLHKSPASRYPSAGALAEDLHRFQSGKPITARPVGLVERATKWVRRSPAKAMLIAAGVFVALAAGGGSLWAMSAHASLIAAVNGDLDDAVRLELKSDWREARAALERADIRLGQSGSADLRSRMERVRSELAMVARLDSIRLLRAGSANGVLNDRRAACEYASAFQAAGIGGFTEAPGAVAARIGQTAISPVLVGAIDDWSLALKDKTDAQRAWLDEVARLADRENDPNGWRRSARDPENWNTRESISRLAEEAPVEDQPLPFLYAFGQALDGTSVESLPFLTRAHAAHPSDFWLCTSVANALKRLGRDADSVGYYRAAVALRPDAMVSYYNLGRAVGSIGQHDEAARCFSMALVRDPGAIDALKSLGLALSRSGRNKEALQTYEKAISRDPGDARLHLQVCFTYASLGRCQEAAQSVERSLELNPTLWQSVSEVRGFLVAQGCHDAARSLWAKQLARPTSTLADWDGYAELCLFLGNTAEFERARGVLIDRFGSASDGNSCERLGRACLLAPSTDDQLAAATALVDRALASQAQTRTWAYPYFRLAKALANYRAERFGDAAAIVEGESAGILPPLPRLVAAMCRARMGDDTLARRHLADASITMNWTITRATNREAWMCHVLRREADQLVLPDLERLKRGEVEPLDDTTRLALLGACQAEGLLGRSAALWSSVLGSQIPPPEQLVDPAARSLIIAASGDGADASKYGDADRIAWRELGLRLLTERLNDLERTAGAGGDGLVTARNVLAGWESAEEFRSVRDGPLLGPMPDEERTRWAALWRRVQALTAPTQPTRP